MNAVGGKLCPESINTFQEFGHEPTLTKLILNLPKTAGFTELGEEGIEKVIKSHKEELTDEDLEELQVQWTVTEEEGEDDVQGEPLRILDTKRMAEAYKHRDIVMQIFRRRPT